MEGNSKPDPPPSGKFGKFLAIGMAVALVWGCLLFIIGIFLRFKLGTVIGDLMGVVEDSVKVKSAQGPTGQTIVPLSPDIDDDVDFGKWPVVLACFIIIAGLLTILFACLGIYGGLKHSKFILYITIVFLLIATLLLLGLTTVANDSEVSFHNDAKVEMIAILKEKYKIEVSQEPFTLAMNRIMLWCCGIRNHWEFSNLSFVEAASSKPSPTCFQVPPACCIREFFNTEVPGVTPYTRLKECAIKGDAEKKNLNMQGCYDAIFNYVSTPATVVLVLIIIWNILVLILVILTITEIQPEEEGRDSLQEARKEDLEEPPPVKKFVPFAKISSFVHPDLSRIKSTEIW